MSHIPLRATIAVTAALVMTAVPGHAGQMQMRQLDGGGVGYPSVPQLPPLPPAPRPANEFWVRPVPLPQTPGVIGGGNIGGTQFQGHIFHTPQGPAAGGSVTIPIR